jgi:hypothetical protein
MSAPVAPVAPLPRPVSLFGAAYLLSGAAALWSAAAIATFFALPQFSRYYSDLRGDADAGSVAVFILVAGSIVALVAAGLYVLVAVLTARGLLAARVFAWIFLVVAVGVASGILVVDPYHAVPWHQRLNATVAILTLVLAVAAVVLLVVPSTRRYARATGEARRQRRAQALAARRPVYPPRMAYPQPVYPPPHYQPPPPPAPGNAPMPPPAAAPPGNAPMPPP